MIDKRPFLILPALAMLAACGEGASEQETAASGEVLEGTISDAMLPIDRVRSEAPLEDPEAFAASQTEGTRTSATRSAAGGEEEAQSAETEPDEGEAEESAGEEPVEDAE